MARRLTYANRALADLDGITRWLTQLGSGTAARRRLGAIRSAINRLRHNPCLHPIGQHPGIRELPCASGCRVLYRVVPDTGRSSDAGDVLVLRVFGPGQSRDQL